VVRDQSTPEVLSMKRPRNVALASLGLIMVTACWSGSRADEVVSARIDRIENGLLPAVAVRGEELPRNSIWEVMERYHVPGVSVAVINDGEVEWSKAYGGERLGGRPSTLRRCFLPVTSDTVSRP